MPVSQANSIDDGDRGRQRNERVADAVGREDADGIGAEPDERRMAE